MMKLKQKFLKIYRVQHSDVLFILWNNLMKRIYFIKGLKIIMNENERMLKRNEANVGEWEIEHVT